MLALRKDQTVYLDGVEYLVIRGSADQDTLLENKLTGERMSIKTYTLVTKYLTGEFQTAAQHKSVLRDSITRKPARMDNMSTEAKKETHMRIDYLVRLDKEGAFELGKKNSVRPSRASQKSVVIRGCRMTRRFTAGEKITCSPPTMCAPFLRVLTTAAARAGRVSTPTSKRSSTRS